MAAITDYKLISTEEEDAEVAVSSRPNDWKVYPGDRRSQQQQYVAPPEGLVFVRTGGNALQAVRRDLVEQQNMISVVVPDGREPGDEVLVACPFVKDRLISVTVPKNVTAGSVFLVQPPTTAAEIVTGVPISDPEGGQTPVVNGLDVFAQDELALQEETQVSNAGNSSGDVRSKLSKDPDEEEYEMVERDRFV